MGSYGTYAAALRPVKNPINILIMSCTVAQLFVRSLQVTYRIPTREKIDKVLAFLCGPHRLCVSAMRGFDLLKALT